MANILVIDDDRDIQRLLEFALKRAGHTVNMAYDGEEGLVQAENYSPDLIVCDVMMPKMTGYEFCRKARAIPQLQDTPIIIFSARFQSIDQQTALDAGATDYMAKSAAPDVLVDKIAKLLPKQAPAQDQPSTLMYAVFSLRGGVGVTSLAVNLAFALAQIKKTNTMLVDLANYGGHAALTMGLRPTHSVSQLLATNTSGFTMPHIQPYAIQHTAGVQLLASSPAFGQSLAEHTAHLLPLLTGLKSESEITVLDVHLLLEQHLLATLELLDQIILVSAPDLPSVQSTAIALQGLTKLGVPDSKITIVSNQVNPNNALPLPMIQKAVKRTISTVVPFDPEMAKSANTGKPVLLSKPHSLAARAIGKLAQNLVHKATANPT